MRSPTRSLRRRSSSSNAPPRRGRWRRSSRPSSCHYFATVPASQTTSRCSRPSSSSIRQKTRWHRLVATSFSRSSVSTRRSAAVGKPTQCNSPSARTITMDPAVLSALSALLGSLVGGGASLATAWITQTAQGKRELLTAELHKREALYGEFVNEGSKLIVDSLDHTLERPDIMLNAVAILNRIRLVASPAVLRAAEAVLQVIVQNYVKEK